MFAVLREPHQVTCCGYAFCQACIDKVKKDNKPHSCCKSDRYDKFEDKRLKQSLCEFKVCCTFKQQGCQWVGELGQLDDHLNHNPIQQNQLKGCQFAHTMCYHCSRFFQRCSMQVHQCECPWRPFSCEFCQDFNSNHKDVTTNHWPECCYYPEQCPNKCGETFQRQSMGNHIANNCPLTIVDCDFQHAGCQVRLPRKNMATHLNETFSTHLSLQAAHQKEVVDKLIKEIEQLKLQVAKLTQDLQGQKIFTPICPVEIIVTNFEQKRRNSERWYSSPFYTCQKGYKVCLEVRADGNGPGQGTHVSVFIKLMKGEADDQLKWPFHGKFKIQLLNMKDMLQQHKFLAKMMQEKEYRQETKLSMDMVFGCSLVITICDQNILKTIALNFASTLLNRNKLCII